MERCAVWLLLMIRSRSVRFRAAIGTMCILVKTWRESFRWADAAAKYPGVKSGYSISVGALYAWGLGTLSGCPMLAGVLAALGVFCMVFARVVITDLERAKFAVTGGVVAIAGLRRSEQLFGWWVRRTVSRLVKRWRMLLTVGFLALGVILDKDAIGDVRAGAQG